MNPPPETVLAPAPPPSNGSPPGTPPHNLEAEMSVLGAILISDRTLYALVIEEGLKPEDFYRERHRLIYDAMLRLYREGEPPVELVAVAPAQHGQRRAGGVGPRAARV